MAYPILQNRLRKADVAPRNFLGVCQISPRNWLRAAPAPWSHCARTRRRLKLHGKQTILRGLEPNKIAYDRAEWIDRHCRAAVESPAHHGRIKSVIKWPRNKYFQGKRLRPIFDRFRTEPRSRHDRTALSPRSHRDRTAFAPRSHRIRF